MSKKTLLSESQVRQFMKYAKLEPLTPGFVNEMYGGDEGDESKSRRDYVKEMKLLKRLLSLLRRQSMWTKMLLN